MGTPFHKRRGQVVAMMAVAVGVYLGFALWSGADDLGGAVRATGPGGIAALLSLSLCSYAIRFWRWHVYLLWTGFRVPWRRNGGFFLASFAFTFTPGKLGEAVRSLFLKPYGVPYSTSLSALFTERLLDLTAALLFAALGVSYFSRYTFFVALPVLGVALALLVITSPWVRTRLQAALPGRLAGVLAALDAAATLNRGWRFFGGLSASIVCWGLEALAFYLALQLMGFGVPLVAGVGIYGLAITVGALSFLPGGLGGTEVVMVVLLGLTGVEPAAAGAVTILFRFCTLWFAVLLGLIALLGLRRGGVRLEEAGSGAP